MKWILTIFGGVVIALVLVVAIVLLPAHVQVRGVAPQLPSQSQLLGLRNVSGGDARAPINVSYIVTSSQALERGQIAHISIVVEWANGQRFLIDTGMSEAEADNFAELLQKMDASAGPATVYGTVSELLGSDINTVAGVGFTHLHIDHTQGIKNFCVARGQGAALLQTPSQQALHNFNTSEGAELVSGSCLKPVPFLASRTDNMYQSDQFPGLAAIELGGHTPGSTLWAVAYDERVLLFSGDITNDKHSIDHDIPKPALYSYVLVPEHTERTAELRKWLKTADQSEQFSVIVSHDLASAQAHLRRF